MFRLGKDKITGERSTYFRFYHATLLKKKYGYKYFIRRYIIVMFLSSYRSIFFAKLKFSENDRH